MLEIRTQRRVSIALLVAIIGTLFQVPIRAQEPRALILPEQRTLAIRTPEQIGPVSLPTLPAPATVTQQLPPNTDFPLTLDDAIRIALENCQVVRVLGGNTAIATGQTIYDPAINNTQIDAQRATFDPVLQNRATWSQTDRPTGVLNPTPPPTTVLQGVQTGGFDNTASLSKQFLTGATASAGVNYNRADTRGIFQPLNPLATTTTDLSITQPLLRGAGYRANVAPILIARINTERSFFQMKSSVQDLVQSVITTYWNMQQAVVDIGVRQQQVAQGGETFGRAEARYKAGLGNFESDVAQARVSYENFRAALVVAQGELLQQEGILRNLLGIPPSDMRRLVPTTPLSLAHFNANWPALQSLAETYRPDLIELKLILEADEQQLLLAKNLNQPQLDAIGLYRWNGLDGRTPEGMQLTGLGRDYQEWQAGVNFSVPIGLRSARAGLRQAELIITRDRANLDQGLHRANHELATVYRNLSRAYEQYVALKRTREAALQNVQQQNAAFLANTRVLYLNVLQSITDWGNAVQAETQSLVQYNVALAQMELQTGTILESHGVRFAEERYGSIGPLGKHFRPVCYPMAMSPTENFTRPRAEGKDAYKGLDVTLLPPVDQVDREPIVPLRQSNPSLVPQTQQLPPQNSLPVPQQQLPPQPPPATSQPLIQQQSYVAPPPVRILSRTIPSERLRAP